VGIAKVKYFFSQFYRESGNDVDPPQEVMALVNSIFLQAKLGFNFFYLQTKKIK